MRRTALGTMNIENKSRASAKEKRHKKARPSLSFGNRGRLSNAGARMSGARPITSFGSSRRLRQYGRGDRHTQMKDRRPLRDKSYQLKEIKDILQTNVLS